MKEVLRGIVVVFVVVVAVVVRIEERLCVRRIFVAEWKGVQAQEVGLRKRL